MKKNILFLLFLAASHRAEAVHSFELLCNNSINPVTQGLAFGALSRAAVGVICSKAPEIISDYQFEKFMYSEQQFIGSITTAAVALGLCALYPSSSTPQRGLQLASSMVGAVGIGYIMNLLNQFWPVAKNSPL